MSPYSSVMKSMCQMYLDWTSPWTLPFPGLMPFFSNYLSAGSLCFYPKWRTFGHIVQNKHNMYVLDLKPVLNNKYFRKDAVQFSSVQFDRSVVSNSLRLHESQHARPPCPSPTPGVHSDSHPSSPWCHPAISFSVISFSVVLFSSYPQVPPRISLSQWVNSSHEVARVLEFQLYHHSFQRTPKADLL